MWLLTAGVGSKKAEKMTYVLESKQCFVICGKILVNWGIVSSEVFTFFSESLLLHIFIDESAY